jgi:hypothetical protein
MYIRDEAYVNGFTREQYDRIRWITIERPAVQTTVARYPKRDTLLRRLILAAMAIAAVVLGSR